MKNPIAIRERSTALATPETLRRLPATPATQVISVAVSMIGSGISEIIENRAIARIDNAPIKAEKQRLKAELKAAKQHQKMLAKTEKARLKAEQKQQALALANEQKRLDRQAAHELKMAEIEQKKAAIAPEPEQKSTTKEHHHHHGGNWSVQVNIFDYGCRRRGGC